MDTLEVHRPALAAQHHMDSSMAESGISPGQAFDLTNQRRVVGSAFPIVSQGRSRAVDHPTGSALRPCTARTGNQRRLVAGRGSPLFFGDILEHLFIQEKLGHEPLHSLDLDLELAAPAIGNDLGRVVPLSPAMVGGRGDADLAAEVGDGQTPGQVAVGVFQQSGDFVVGPSLAHGSLPVQVYRGTSISGGPTFGGQPNAAKAKLRGQALGWLKAELAAWAKVFETGPAPLKAAIAPTLRHWKADTDLAGLREADALAKLPEAERKDWQALWANDDALLARAQTASASAGER
jgi:hypothetical protein